MRKLTGLVAFLALASVSTLPAAAQSGAEAPAFGEIIDVRVINLEVVVTDGKERVSGLSSEDFRLLVDGKEVPIEYFTEVLGGHAVSPSAAAEGAIPALLPGEAVGTRFLVFIDESFAIRTHRNRVLRKLRDQLPHLGPDDHMAVVAFDGREIEMLTSWTSSQPELERVLEKAQERKSYGLHRRLRTQDFYTPARFGYTSGFGDPFGRDPFFNDFGLRREAYAPRGSLAYSDTERVLDAAISVMRAFARPPGRKVMLLLSGGWPVGAVGGFTPAVGYRGGASDRVQLRPLADTANRLGYTLYPVDVKGLESHFGGAQHGSFGEAAFAADFGRHREWLEESALVYLAEETGGRAMIDGASRSALQRAVEDTRSYYWLGFTPSWREDDRRHRVKVQVREKGLKVRARNSFSDLSRQTEVSMMLESAQLFDLPMPGEDRDLGVSFGEPQPGGFRKVLVPVRLEIPLDQVTLLPHAEGSVAQLEVRVAVTDDRGRDATIPVIPVQLRSDPADQETAAFELSLKLRRRPHQLLISVHDPASGSLISKRVDLTL